MIELYNWAFCNHPDESPYHAPEQYTLHLRGIVWHHPNCKDGSLITTSEVIGAIGRVITCKSRTYLLVGDPNPTYVYYMKQQDKVLDFDNPLGTTNFEPTALC
jgi:hypothetical protein